MTGRWLERRSAEGEIGCCVRGGRSVSAQAPGLQRRGTVAPRRVIREELIVVVVVVIVVGISAVGCARDGIDAANGRTAGRVERGRKRGSCEEVLMVTRRRATHGVCVERPRARGGGLSVRDDKRVDMMARGRRRGNDDGVGALIVVVIVIRVGCVILVNGRTTEQVDDRRTGEAVRRDDLADGRRLVGTTR